MLTKIEQENWGKEMKKEMFLCSLDPRRDRREYSEMFRRTFGEGRICGRASEHEN